jgi:hypothetical protein
MIHPFYVKKRPENETYAKLLWENGIRVKWTNSNTLLNSGQPKDSPSIMFFYLEGVYIRPARGDWMQMNRTKVL